MTDYESGYKDGMASAALPNVIDNGDKIDGYAYSYKTDSDGVPYINIDCVRNMLDKAADVQPVKHGYWEEVIDYGGWGDIHYRCSVCGEEWYLEDGKPKDNNMNFCPRCGARMGGDTECQ